VARVVFVHGIGQEQYSADVLERKWIDALAGGIRNAGRDAIADSLRRTNGQAEIECRMAFYGNVFLSPGAQGSGAPLLNAEEQDFAEQLALEWLKNVAERGVDPRDVSLAQREIGVRLSGLEGAQGLGQLVRRSILCLSKIPWFAVGGMGLAETFLNTSLAQVTKYLVDDSTRQRVQERVHAAISSSTQVLIGHSLGSVIAYEAAHTVGINVPLLVTLGSPLGLHSVVYQRLRPQPPTYPSRVQRWVNVADRDDYIAAQLDLTMLFSRDRPATAVVENYLVDNGSSPHNAEHYLGKVQVGRALSQIFDPRQ
jgi:hypothetical protein